MIRELAQRRFKRSSMADVEAWQRFLEALRSSNGIITIDGPPPQFHPIPVPALYDHEVRGDFA